MDESHPAPAATLQRQGLQGVRSLCCAPSEPGRVETICSRSPPDSKSRARRWTGVDAPKSPLSSQEVEALSSWIEAQQDAHARGEAGSRKDAAEASSAAAASKCSAETVLSLQGGAPRAAARSNTCSKRAGSVAAVGAGSPHAAVQDGHPPCDECEAPGQEGFSDLARAPRGQPALTGVGSHGIGALETKGAEAGGEAVGRAGGQGAPGRRRCRRAPSEVEEVVPARAKETHNAGAG